MIHPTQAKMMHAQHAPSQCGRSVPLYAVLLALVALFTIPLAAAGQSVVLTADTYYATSGVSGNVGALNSFLLGGADADVGLLQFDLTTLPVGITAANVGLGASASLPLFEPT